MLNLSKRGLRVIFPKPWMEKLFLIILEKSPTTSLNAIKFLGPDAPSRTAVINFLNKMCGWGLLGMKPEIVDGRMQYVYSAEPLFSGGIDPAFVRATLINEPQIPFLCLSNNRDGFKQYLVDKLKYQLEVKS